jgi:hypothetical protein
VADLRAQKSGTSVILTWTHSDVSVDHYEVWWSDTGNTLSSNDMMRSGSAAVRRPPGLTSSRPSCGILSFISVAV